MCSLISLCVRFSINERGIETLSIKQALDSLNLGSIRMFLMSLYHREGAGRKPYDPVSMLKAFPI